MTILNKQILLFTEDQLTSSQADSHASHIALLENEKGKGMNAIYGQKCLEQFKRLSQPGLWAKTFAGLLIGMEDWYSTKCKLIWKLKGTKSNRFYFQLAVSKLPTKGIEFGLLPTPATMDTNTNLEKIDSRRKRLKKRHTGRNGTTRTGNGFGVTLNELLLRGLLPTPTARDYRSGFNPENGKLEERMNHSRGVNLHEHLQRESIGENFQLNTRFVMEMMGFPPNWTELPFQNGEKKV